MLEECHTSVDEIKKMVDDVSELFKGKPISRALKSNFHNFNNQLELYSNAIQSQLSNPQSIIDIAKMIAVYGQGVSQSLRKDENKNIRSLAEKIRLESESFRSWTENRPEFDEIHLGEKVDIGRLGEYIPKRSDTEIKEAEKRHLSEVEKDLLVIKENFDRYKKEMTDLLSGNETKVLIMTKNFQELEENAKNELEKIDKLYNEKIVLLEGKEKEINGILNLISKKTIAGNFEESAKAEKGTANILRGISLGIMLFIVLIVGYSFWETTQKSFEWQSSIFRIVLVIFLSIPATYLARESTKHRQQQYRHLQMALELKATTPYWNSLPEDEQHKLKIELSKKMFAQDNMPLISEDSFPINSQELISKLIDKIPSSEEKSK